MPRRWWASAESKYWCNHCYFQCWHTTNLQFILLFTTLFIQPVQIEPQPPLPTSFPPSFPSPTMPPPLSNFAFPLDLCVMTWPGSDRHYTQDCLQRERENERGKERKREWGSDINVTLTVTTDVTNTSGCIRTFSPPHTLAHTHTITSGIDCSRAKLQFFFVSLQITSVKQIASHKMRARYTVSGVELEGNLVVLYLEEVGCWWETQWK